MAIYPLLAVIFWGISFVATKIALRELEPQTLILLRFSIGLVFLFLLLQLSQLKRTIKRSDYPLVLFSGVIVFSHLMIQVTGMKYTTATNTGWLVSTSLIFVAILSAIFFKEKFSYMKISGIIVGFVGIILLVSKGDFKSLDFVSTKGDILVLISALTWAIYTIASKKVFLTYSSLTATFYFLLIVFLLLIPFNLNQKSLHSVISLSSQGWYAIIFLGFFCSGLAYLLWSKALEKDSATKVSVYLYLEPFITLIAASIILKEALTFFVILGGLLIISGVFLVSQKSS